MGSSMTKIDNNHYYHYLDQNEGETPIKINDIIYPPIIMTSVKHINLNEITEKVKYVNDYYRCRHMVYIKLLKINDNTYDIAWHYPRKNHVLNDVDVGATFEVYTIKFFEKLFNNTHNPLKPVKYNVVFDLFCDHGAKSDIWIQINEPHHGYSSGFSYCSHKKNFFDPAIVDISSHIREYIDFMEKLF